MSTEDRFASFDAAYVLGALSGKDRQEFEHHLRSCEECARSVRELAGMPGLLSRVPESLVAEPPSEPPPPRILDGLLWQVRKQRRRSRWTAVGASTVAAAACLMLVLVFALRPFSGGEKEPVSIPTATMSPIGSAPVWATIGLRDVAWGTKVDMHCMYEKTDSYQTGKWRYVLVVVPKHGEPETIGSWMVRPGKDASLQAATSLQVEDISAVEIRTTTGKALLRMKP